MKRMTERLPASVWPVHRLAGRCWWWFWEMAALRRRLFRYAGRARRGEWEPETREVVVMGRKWKVEVCALPWGDLYKWPQIEGMLCGMHTDFAAYVQFIFPSLSWWCCTLRDGGTEGGWECGAVEEWLPGVELRDVERGYFILSIGVCKWKCQSGRKTNESDRRDATSLAKRLINCHCLLRALGVFLLVIFWLFSPPGPAVSRLRFWWWTLSQGNKGIDRRRESMLSSVTYKRGAVKSDSWIRVL